MLIHNPSTRHSVWSTIPIIHGMAFLVCLARLWRLSVIAAQPELWAGQWQSSKVIFSIFLAAHLNLLHCIYFKQFA